MRTFAQQQNQPQEQASFSLVRPTGPNHHTNPILHLQRTIGNQAAQPILQTHAEELKAGLTAAASSRFGHDFSRIPILSPAAGGIQTKLAINKPGDQYEQEASRFADQVMRRRRHFESPHQDAISNTEGLIHASASHRSSGEKALEPEDRQFFESRFNHNFADVRVYADHEANKSALGLQARAYTVGNNISFAPGEYRPGTTEGRHLGTRK